MVFACTAAATWRWIVRNNITEWGLQPTLRFEGQTDRTSGRPNPHLGIYMCIAVTCSVIGSATLDVANMPRARQVNGMDVEVQVQMRKLVFHDRGGVMDAQ